MGDSNMPKKKPRTKEPQAGGKPERTRYRFFLSPYPDMAFTRCPKCETKTGQRRLPLVIHIEPRQLFILNKTCRYCERCDLLIARKADVEAMMAETFATRAPDIVGNEYLVIGTLDRADWREGAQSMLRPAEVIDRVYVFEDVWDFEVDPGGWYPACSRSAAPTICFEDGVSARS